MKTKHLNLTLFIIALSLTCIRQHIYGQTSYRGVEMPVNALAVDTNGSVYAGGNFHIAGNIPANCIASWTPSTRTWSTLPDGTTGIDGVRGGTVIVNAIAIGDDGKVYVGGSFSAAGNQNASNIASWDPNTRTWSNMSGGVGVDNSGFSAYVSGICVVGTKIYVVGKFSTAGSNPSIAVTNIAVWDSVNNTWASVAPLPQAIGVPNTIASDGSTFYVGGYGVAQGQLTTWQQLVPNEILYVKAIAIIPGGRVFFGGEFTPTPSTTVGIVEWNGTDCVPLPNVFLNADPVYAISFFNRTNLIVGGDFMYDFPINSGVFNAYNVVGYNLETTDWFVLRPGDVINNYNIIGGVNTTVDALAISPGTNGIVSTNGIVYAGGTFAKTIGNDDCASYVAAWDSGAGNWSILGNNSSPTVSITSPADGSTFGAQATITITANAEDDCGIIELDFYEGTTLLKKVNPPSFSASWNDFVTVSLPPGTYYFSAVAKDCDGAISTSSAVAINVISNSVTSPTVIVPPQSQSVCLGDPATFSVGVDGTEPLNYQWQFNGCNIPYANLASYTINSVTANDAGSYTVVVNNSAGSTSSTAILTVETPTPTPTGFTATPGNAQVVLNWNASSGATSYNIKRSTTHGGPYYTLTPSPTGTSYIDSSLVNGTTYFYVVSAVNSCGESANSSEVSATPQPPPCSNSPSGLVSWWPGEGNANDSMGANNGTLQGPVGFAAGEVGQAFVFNGSSTSVQVPASSSLNVGSGGGFTVETWVKPVDIYSHIVENLVEWNNGSGSIGTHLELSVNAYGDLFANIKDTTGASHYIYTAGGVVATNVFQHVALTYDKASGVAVLYLNGMPVATQNLGTFVPQTSYDLYFGKRPSGPFTPSYFNGLMDEISLYNRALSSCEIQAIYNAGSAGKCPPSSPSCTPAPLNLVSWWPGEGNANDIVSANNGIAHNITYSAGEVGQTFVFNGTSSYIQIPASYTLNVGLTNGFTFEAWVNPAGPKYLENIFEWNQGSGSGSGPIGVHMQFGSATSMALYANVVDTAGNQHYISSAANIITLNTFQHVALTYNKLTGTGTLYRNGVMVANVNMGAFTPQTSFNFYLGLRPAGNVSGNYLWGELDEASLYNRALSACEIQAICNAGIAGKCH